MDLDPSVRKVAALTAPRNVVVVGASDNPGSWPAVVWETIKRYGFPRPIYPVNPNRQTIGSDRCYRDFMSLPEPPDHLVMLIPSALIPDALRAGAQAGARTATVFSSGFGETGTPEGLALERRLLDVLAETGIAISGPNCTGNICAGSRLVTLVDHRVFKVEPGPVALVGQSGGVLLYANHILADRGIQISYALTSGNEASLTTGDYIAFLAGEPNVKVIFCYVEAIKEPEKFKAACSAAQAAGKPVIVFKLGSSEAGRQAAVTHTGALAEHRDLRAVAGERGVIRVDTLDGHRDNGACSARWCRSVTGSGDQSVWRLSRHSARQSMASRVDRCQQRKSSGNSVGRLVSRNPADGGFRLPASINTSIDRRDRRIAHGRYRAPASCRRPVWRELKASGGSTVAGVVEAGDLLRCIRVLHRLYAQGPRQPANASPETKVFKALSYLADWSDAAHASQGRTVGVPPIRAAEIGRCCARRSRVAVGGPRALNEPSGGYRGITGSASRSAS
jgi:succinyl-CoA synthetase alpha subunit